MCQRFVLLGLTLLVLLWQPSMVFALSSQVSIEEGTPVRLKLQEAISSKKSSTGQKIHLTVLEDVVGKDGKTVGIREGVSAVAYLTNVDEKDGAKGGKLNLEITSVKAVDDTRVALRGFQSKSGKNGAGVGSYVLGGVLFGLVGLGVVALFSGGSHVKIPAGTILTAFVDHDVLVAIKPEPEQQVENTSANVTAEIAVPAGIVNSALPTASSLPVSGSPPPVESMKPTAATPGQ